MITDGHRRAVIVGLFTPPATTQPLPQNNWACGEKTQPAQRTSYI